MLPAFTVVAAAVKAAPLEGAADFPAGSPVI